MGVKFSKEMVLSKEQVVPTPKDETQKELTPIQDKLIKKFGKDVAYPFTFSFPSNSPSSVTLQPGEDDNGKPLGVEYAVKAFVADGTDDRSHKRSSVAFAIKKVTI